MLKYLKEPDGIPLNLTRGRMDGVNYVKEKYTDRSGVERKATALGNGRVELLLNYPAYSS